MKLSVCADIMYRQIDFLERIEKLKNNGYYMMEFWKWTNKDIGMLKKETEKHGMKVYAFCIDSSDENVASMIWSHALNSGNKQALYSAVSESINVAKQLGTNNLIITVGDNIGEIDKNRQIDNIYSGLEFIAELLKNNGITLLVEPINLQERKNYLLPDANDVISIIKNIDCENIRVLYDIYHQSMGQNFKIETMLEALPFVGHIHIADCPGRGEPGTGTIDYKSVFDALRKIKYNGTVGLEFCPTRGEENALNAIWSL